PDHPGQQLPHPAPPHSQQPTAQQRGHRGDDHDDDRTHEEPDHCSEPPAGCACVRPDPVVASVGPVPARSVQVSPTRTPRAAPPTVSTGRCAPTWIRDPATTAATASSPSRCTRPAYGHSAVT